MKSKWLLPRLGVNIDHVATLKRLRDTPYPDLIEVANQVAQAGAHQITVHLREDQRHIQEADVFLLRKKSALSLNLEMSLAPKIQKIALKVKPDWVCLVPEKRAERTTEGGLDVKKYQKSLAQFIKKCRAQNIKVSLFIEPSLSAVKLSHQLGAHAVELHTGRYANACQKAFGARSSKIKKETFKALREAAELAHRLGLGVHAGHGFDAQNIRAVAALDLVEEYNVGHFIVCRAVEVGMDQAVKEMLSAIQAP